MQILTDLAGLEKMPEDELQKKIEEAYAKQHLSGDSVNDVVAAVSKWRELHLSGVC